MKQESKRAGTGAAPPALSLRTRLALVLVAVTMAVALHLAGSQAAPPPPDSALSPRQLETRSGLIRSEASRVRGADAPLTEDAVALLLLQLADDPGPGDLGRAEAMARGIVARSPGTASPGVLYAVALAGGNTLADGDALLGDARRLMTVSPERATTDTFARLVQDFFRRASVLGTPVAFSEALVSTDNFLQSRVRRNGNRLQPLPGGSAADFTSFLDHLESLNAAMAAAEVAGNPGIVEAVRLLGHEMLLRYWDNAGGRLEFPARDVVGLPPSVVPILNARAASSLWRAGWITGDPMFRGRSQRLLDAILGDAAKTPESAMAAAAAAALLSREPLLVIVVGESDDPALSDLRRLANSFFQPRKVVVHLHPQDTDRAASLGIDLSQAPCVALRVGDTVSQPIRDAESLPGEAARLLERIAGGK